MGEDAAENLEEKKEIMDKAKKGLSHDSSGTPG